METLRTVVASLCVTFVFFGVIMMLVPEGAMQKSVKTFISVAIVSIIVAVVSGASTDFSHIKSEFDFDVDSRYADSVEKTSDELNLEVTRSTVENLISEKLTENNIEFLEISVNADILEDKSISITEVEIVCFEGDGQKCQAILNELGLKGVVTER